MTDKETPCSFFDVLCIPVFIFFCLLGKWLEIDE